MYVYLYLHNVAMPPKHAPTVRSCSSPGASIAGWDDPVAPLAIDKGMRVDPITSANMPPVQE